MKTRIFILVASIIFSTFTPAQEPKAKVLAGWPDSFPEITGYSRTFEKPKIDKGTYRQTAVYEWTGGRIETVRVTLARDANEAAFYTKEGIKKFPVAPDAITFGKHAGWVWRPGMLVVAIGKDRFIKIEAPTADKFQSDLPAFAKKFDLEACAKSLDQPPRTDFRRKLDAFRGLRKGMSLAQVRERVGDADQDIGSGIHILEYRLDDGSSVLIGFPDFNRLLYVKHRDASRKVVDLTK